MKVSDFKPEEGKVAVLFVEPYAPSFAGAIAKLASDSDVQVVECASALEAASIARTLSGCLILCHVATPEQALRLTTLQRLIGPAIQRKQARVLLTSSARDDFENQKLANQLLAELLSEPVSEKSLLFKASRLMKLVPRLGVDRGAKGAGTRRDGRDGRNEGGDELEIEQGPALELQSDCWALPVGRSSLQQHIRTLGGRWHIKIHGPAPESGSWQAVDSGDLSIEAWQWVPSDPQNDPFILEEGAWIFRGQQPEHKGGLWNFVSKAPDLSFFYDGESYGSKFTRTERGSLLYSKDSDAGARARQAAVQAASKASGRQEASESEGAAKGRGEAEPQREDTRAAAAAPVFEMTEPLQLESDFWSIQGRKPKRVANKWVVTLLGPGPDSGSWSRLEGGESDVEWWQWIPSSADDPFVQEEGAWLYRGTQPKYVEELWTFVAPDPELSFYYDGESYGSKFSTDETGKLRVSRDSQAARKAQPLIEASADRVIKITAGKEEKAAEQEQEGAAREASFHVLVEEFGEPGGEWEAASVGTQDRRWFVYLSPAVLDGQDRDIRKLGPYWLYFGPGYPKLDDHGWIFRERRPQATPAFGDLPKQIQKFLLDYFGGSEAKAESAGRKPPREKAEEFTVLSGGAREKEEETVESRFTSPENGRTEDDEEQSDSTEADPGAETVAEAEAREVAEEVAAPEDATEGAISEDGEPARKTASKVMAKAGPGPAAEPDSEFVTISAGAAATQAPESDFKVAVTELGASGGKWEVAGTGSDGRRWYVYLPIELLRDVVTDARRLGVFWTYFGPSVPTLRDGTHYSFRARPPQSVTRFGDLPRTVQDFLARYGKSEQATVPGATSAEGSKGTDYYRLDAPEKGRVTEDFVEKAEPARGGAADFVDKAETPRGIDPRTFQAEAASTVAKVFKGELQGNGPKLIQATHPPGPSLTPIAMAFLMSELICKRDLDRKRIGGRYCEYLSASTGGLKSELWVRSGAVWFCAGTSDGGDGAFGACFAGGKRPEKAGMEGGFFVAPVKVPAGGREIILGALVLGGPGCELVAPEYARAVARIARGLVLSLGSEQGLPAEADESAA